MATIDISYAKERYPGMTEEEVAAAMAKEDGYVVVVRYKLRPGKPYECFGVCWTYEEADAYLRAQHLTDVEVVYDRRRAEREPPKVTHNAQNISRSIVFGESGQASEPCCWNCAYFTVTLPGLYLCCKGEAERGNVQVHRSDWCSFWKEHTRNIDACSTPRIPQVEPVQTDEKDALNMGKPDTRTGFNKYGERTGMTPEEFAEIHKRRASTLESSISSSKQSGSLDEFNGEPTLPTSEQQISDAIEKRASEGIRTEQYLPQIEDYSDIGCIIVSDLFVAGRRITALVSNIDVKPTTAMFAAWVEKQAEDAIKRHDNGQTPYSVLGPAGHKLTIHRNWRAEDGEVNIVATPSSFGLVREFQVGPP